MRQGQFYFISDEFYDKFDTNGTLMKNKDGMHDRPCFFAFPDKEDNEIYWCVPISSKVEKYERIYNQKIQRQINKGVLKPKCNTIRFGEVLGRKSAFLIQNMFPITEKYVTSVYIDRNTNNPVTISNDTAKDIIKNARDVLKLVSRGYSELIFSDIVNIKQMLKIELHDIDVCLNSDKICIYNKKPIRIKDRLAAAKTEAERINSERGTVKTTPYKDRER